MKIKRFNESINEEFNTNELVDIIETFKVELDEAHIKTEVVNSFARNYITSSLVILDNKLTNVKSNVLADIIKRMSNIDTMTLSINTLLKNNPMIEISFKSLYEFNYESIIEILNDKYDSKILDSNNIKFNDDISPEIIISNIEEYMNSLGDIEFNISKTKRKTNRYSINILNSITLIDFLLDDKGLIFI